MMGERTVAQDALFYSFNLERHVPADHLLRSIDQLELAVLSPSSLVGSRPLRVFSRLAKLYAATKLARCSRS